MTNQSETNQIVRGRARLGFSRDKKLTEKQRRDVYEAGCPAGGKKEFIRNYDGQIKSRVYIKKRLAQGAQEEDIYDELVVKGWI